MSRERTIVRVVRGEEKGEGVGATVLRTIGTQSLRLLDPFLLLDEFTVGLPAGFPSHPHRGFETITIMLTGEVEHRDSRGGGGVIGPGEVQWMTAGRGIVHSEMPTSPSPATGLQLWLNLRKLDKFVEPQYRKMRPFERSMVEADGGRVSVIAGRYGDVDAGVEMRTPITLLQVETVSGMDFETSCGLGPNQGGFIYCYNGSLHYKDLTLLPGDLGVLGQQGDILRFQLGIEGKCLVGYGTALGEPVVQSGPFVMNTKAEIMEAHQDYYHNRF